jgi:8-oxo-dGTP pyrophosphatase MutT (NUDIX family)
MQLNLQALTGPVRDAATVVMLRDGPNGLEVFLIKRHGLSDVLGGAYVFPGGKVDAGDALIDAPSQLDSAGEQLHAALGEPELPQAGAARYYVAALREAFEETGVLFAHGADSATAARATALVREGASFGAAVAQLGLRLATSELSPWVRWITPKLAAVSSKRFDTRFFLAAVPPGQQPVHDNHEAVDSIWLSPRRALQQYWDQAIALAPPQIMSLAHLARHDTVASVLAQAHARLPPLIEPESFEQDGVRVLCYPGDERHSVPQRRLPGPTRLSYRNRRFEPDGGFEALFG